MEANGKTSEEDEDCEDEDCDDEDEVDGGDVSDGRTLYTYVHNLTIYGYKKLIHMRFPYLFLI